jgi:hypothetical protein
LGSFISSPARLSLDALFGSKLLTPRLLCSNLLRCCGLLKLNL